MKKITTTSLVLLSVFGFLITVQAQESFQKINGEGYRFNETKKPCLTLEQRENIKISLKESLNLLKQENKLAFKETNKAGGHVLFDWPIQQAAGFSYNDTWAISGYVDHNTAYPNQLQDYNCGTQTYDTTSGYNHQGVDIYLWPFWWKQMDDNQTEIIAAASGQIIAKGDGQFDRSCGFNSNQWNAVYVQHSDGSVAWYGHMKNGSVTTKNVGDMVTTGEVLGTVGSSGNSTGPHLHFEVYTNASYTQLVDPYYGTCNSLNGDSWWLNQNPYSNPSINAALTHSDNPVVFSNCPDQETTFESINFELGDTIYLTAFLRDQVAGNNVSVQILRPDNSVFYNTSFNATSTGSLWYYYWFFNSFDVIGEWKWIVNFQGESITHLFNIQTLSIDENELQAVSIYPNPTKDYINISSSNPITKAQLIDIQGKRIKTIQNVSEGIQKMSLGDLSNGMYFLSLESDSNHKKTFKIIKE